MSKIRIFAKSDPIFKMIFGIAKIYRKASKRKQIKKQKKKSWKENETNNKFYEQSEQGKVMTKKTIHTFNGESMGFSDKMFIWWDNIIC